jgi:Na+-transporting NADH:ubiquinone oxidoreductase subunit NqrC
VKQRLYNVGFTVVLCAICAGALTFANTYWGPIYKENQKRDRYAAAIEAAGVVKEAPSGAAQVREIFMRSVHKTKTEGVLKVMDGDKLVAWAIEVKGVGLEGPIHAFLGVKTDRETVIGFRVYHQEETPGLGSRCQDPEFTDQFPDRIITLPTGFGMELHTPAEKRYQFNKINGATKTSEAIERMLNAGILQFIAGKKLYPLAIEYPPKLFDPPNGPRAPIMVPEGVKNIALGRKVSVMDDDDPMDGEVKQITDGVKDAGDTTRVEFMAFGAMWIQFDLEAKHEIYGVLIWHEHQEKTTYNDVIVQVAADAEFTENVQTVFNNDRDNSAELGAGKDADIPESFEGMFVDAQKKTLMGLEPAVGRYVRIYSGGNSADENTNRYTEVEIYGKPASEDTGEGDAGGADAGSEDEE